MSGASHGGSSIREEILSSDHLSDQFKQELLEVERRMAESGSASILITVGVAVLFGVPYVWLVQTFPVPTVKLPAFIAYVVVLAAATYGYCAWKWYRDLRPALQALRDDAERWEQIEKAAVSLAKRIRFWLDWY